MRVQAGSATIKVYAKARAGISAAPVAGGMGQSGNRAGFWGPRRHVELFLLRVLQGRPLPLSNAQQKLPHAVWGQSFPAQFPRPVHVLGVGPLVNRIS